VTTREKQRGEVREERKGERERERVDIELNSIDNETRSIL